MTSVILRSEWAMVLSSMSVSSWSALGEPCSCSSADALQPTTWGNSKSECNCYLRLATTADCITYCSEAYGDRHPNLLLFRIFSKYFWGIPPSGGFRGIRQKKQRCGSFGSSISTTILIYITWIHHQYQKLCLWQSSEYLTYLGLRLTQVLTPKARVRGTDIEWA